MKAYILISYDENNRISHVSTLALQNKKEAEKRHVDCEQKKPESLKGWRYELQAIDII